MKKQMAETGVLLVSVIVLLFFSSGVSAELLSSETLLTDIEDTPSYLRDRGEGVSSSMFGTYITKGQLL